MIPSIDALPPSGGNAVLGTGNWEWRTGNDEWGNIQCSIISIQLYSRLTSFPGAFIMQTGNPIQKQA
jgi:hypothetical protein